MNKRTRLLLWVQVLLGGGYIVWRIVNVMRGAIGDLTPAVTMIPLMLIVWWLGIALARRDKKQ